MLRWTTGNVSKSVRTRASEAVGGQDVGAAAEDEGGHLIEGLQRQVQAGPDPLRGDRVSSPSRTAGRQQVGEMFALRGVEAQGPGEAVPDLLGWRPGAALFQAGVVLGANPGKASHLVPAQAGHAPATAVRRQPGLIGRDPSPA
jgi:hypothetical protein